MNYTASLTWFRQWLAGWIALLLVIFPNFPASAGAVELPDLSDPKTAMETWLRLKGDLAGHVTYEWATGMAYGVPQDAPYVALFAIESVTIRQIRNLGNDRYEERSISCRLYKNADTGTFIDDFLNPLTGKQVELIARCRPGQPVRYSPERMEIVVPIAWESSVLDKPMSLDLTRAGDEVIIRRKAFSAFTAESGEIRRELAVDTFRLPAETLADTSATNLSSSGSWDAVRDWSRLLDMPDTPGHMFWSVVVKSYQDAGQLPTAFRAALEERVPGALEQAPDWED